MKSIVTLPILLLLVFISSSCGSSSDEDQPVVYQPVVSTTEALPPTIDEPVGYQQTAIPVNSAIPIARSVQGRPGFVFNPYNQNMVEVEGISTGTKVRDPQDPDPSHIFMVP